MPELLKNLYNENLINSLANNITKNYQQFDSNGFIENIFDDSWSNLELKARMRHISQTLYKFLPDDYQQSIKILTKVAVNFTGFQYMFFPDFVELYGINNYKASIKALAHFTKFSSSEFAVRVFIKKDKNKMMKQMQQWAYANNHHIRRLASEGCRSRLSWAMSLPEFKKNPNLILPILAHLKDDDSLYVRRSVANNLNDISKDNPQIVINIAKDWLGKNANLNWLVKHACRSLLKQGNQEILSLFGFNEPKNISIKDFKVDKFAYIGHNLEFSFVIKTKNKKLGKLRLEYIIEFVKNNAKLAPKIFKISEANLLSNTKIVKKKYSFKKISTRTYYPGKHKISIIVNGCKMNNNSFDLLI